MVYVANYCISAIMPPASISHRPRIVAAPPAVLNEIVATLK